ncbi:SIR2 family protein [candidate division KSB1 bacterium]|nr:SIR2 family protein [bacterium]NUM67383.1 SIR2 family protein [candidate division KSB1 bacterium]
MPGYYRIISNLDDFLRKLQKSSIAILCGSGISSGSGLPIAKDFITYLLAQCNAKSLFGHLQIQLPEGVPLRFEGLLEVLQRTVDPNLEILDMCYFPTQEYQRVPNKLHYHLATIAQNRPVVTTNFDTLIEEALHRMSSSSNCFNAVYFRQKDWNVGNSVTNGLWKIHGTIREWDNIRSWIPSRESGPVATLRSISRTRRDADRHAVLKAILQKFNLVVVGYSGTDDFDISQWLTELPSEHDLYWVAFSSVTKQLDALFTKRKENGIRSNVYVYEAHNDLKNVEIILRCASNANFTEPKVSNWNWKAAIDKWTVDHLSSSWEKQIVTGELLKHCSKFKDAITVFQNARETVRDDPRKKAITLVLLSEAQLEISDSQARKLALNNAEEAKSLFLSMPNTERYLQAAKIACAAALRLAPVPNKEMAAVLLREVIDNSTADLLEKARALAELARLRRHTGKDALYTQEEFEKLSEGDLYVEALIKHEIARNERWKPAKNRREVEDAIKEMESARLLREQLGDVRGLWASTIVLGNMYLRLAEWLEWDSVPEFRAINAILSAAEELDIYSIQLAKNHELDWEMATAQRELSVYYLRAMNIFDHLHKAEVLFKEAEQARPINQPAENVKLDFLKILLEIALIVDADAALEVGYKQFKKLYEKSNISQGIIEDRLRGAIYFNWKLCQMNVGKVDPTSLLRNKKTKGIRNVQYWQERIKHIRQSFRQNSSGLEVMRMLLDPLAP